MIDEKKPKVQYNKMSTRVLLEVQMMRPGDLLDNKPQKKKKEQHVEKDFGLPE